MGVDVPKKNNCDLKTKGWEVSLSWKDRLNNGLNYGISVSLSDQVTYIDSYPGNKTGTLPYYSLTENKYKTGYITGHKINEIWGYETIGIAKTQEEMDAHLASLPNGGQTALGSQWAAGDIMYKDLNNDGKISEGSSTLEDHGDLKLLGDANPHYFYGIDLTASWKGFDFRCFLQGVIKHDFWPGMSSYFWGFVVALVNGSLLAWKSMVITFVMNLSDWTGMKFLLI